MKCKVFTSIDGLQLETRVNEWLEVNRGITSAPAISSINQNAYMLIIWYNEIPVYKCIHCENNTTNEDLDGEHICDECWAKKVQEWEDQNSNCADGDEKEEGSNEHFNGHVLAEYRQKKSKERDAFEALLGDVSIDIGPAPNGRDDNSPDNLSDYPF